MSAPRVLVVKPLTRAEFAPFGDVIETEGAKFFPINEGSALRFNDLARIDVGTNGGHAVLSIFRGQPVSFPLHLSEVERHPLGSQAFVPLGMLPFLVVVAATAPDGQPGEARAFLSNGRQGVNYGRGVWHHPLLSLGRQSDFAVVDRAGPGENCDVAALPEPCVIASPPV